MLSNCLPPGGVYRNRKGARELDLSSLTSDIQVFFLNMVVVRIFLLPQIWKQGV